MGLHKAKSQNKKNYLQHGDSLSQTNLSEQGIKMRFCKSTNQSRCFMFQGTEYKDLIVIVVIDRQFQLTQCTKCCATLP